MEPIMSDTKATNKTSRRTFIKTAAATAGAFTIVPRHVLGGPDHTAPSEMLNIAVIGTGGQGISNIKQLLQFDDVQVIAIADPNEQSDYSRFYYGGVAGRKPALKVITDYYKKKRPEYKGCSEYIDYRKMLANEKAIDAVLVATPDHVHANATMAALNAGKGVYCEKPMTRTIFEARRITAAARKAKVATQMGNHGHSGEGIRLTCEWIWDGAIGDVRTVHVWSEAGRTWTDGKGRPTDTQAVPKGLNWDLWQGPRPKRPYNIAYTPYNWRGWWEYGGGSIGDMACHNIDPAVWALKLGYPDSVEASSVKMNDENTPFGAIVRYKFPARGTMPPVELIWYDGGLLPPRPEELEAERQMGSYGNGIIFEGDKGKMMGGGWAGTPRIIPEPKMKAYKRPAKTLKRSSGHHRDWVNACKGGDPASGSFEYSGHLTELVLLGALAIRADQKIICNGTEIKGANGSVDHFVKAERRPGWEL